MGVKLARQKEEYDLIKKEPQPLTEFRPANFDADYKKLYDELNPDSGSDSDSDEGNGGKRKNAAAVDSDDEWNNVGQDRQTRRTNQRREEKKAHWEKNYGAKVRAAKLIEMTQPAAEEEDEDQIDDEETGGEWITEENL